MIHCIGYTKKTAIESNLYLFVSSNIAIMAQISDDIVKDMPEEGNIYFHHKLNTHSGEIDTYGLISLESYKQFLLLQKKTKSIWIKVLTYLSNLPVDQRYEVIKGRLKIPGAGPAVIKRIGETNAILEDTGYIPEIYERLLQTLQKVNKDIDKAKQFLRENKNLGLECMSEDEVKRMYINHLL